ncbi:hypothetical protein ACFXBB_01995 [Streptomyces scopuliridis]
MTSTSDAVCGPPGMTTVALRGNGNDEASTARPGAAALIPLWRYEPS